MDHIFSQKDKDLARVWSGFWAVANAAATLIVLATFATKPSRFQYPVRPVICIVVCHFVLAVGRILHIFLESSDVICRDTDRGDGGVIISDGKDSTPCIILFLIQYYFSFAAKIWWVALTLAWFLAAAQKWGVEAIRSLACYFHLAAWSIPAVLAITVLVTGAVDADELMGSCSVGNTNADALLGFVVAPLLVLLLLGMAFLFGGFVSLMHVRRSLRDSALGGAARAAGDVARLEKLMAKIGLFSAFCIVATACHVGALFYEYAHQHAWTCVARALPCLPALDTSASASATPAPDCSLEISIPSVEVFLLKECATLVVGILSAMWIFNSKTVDSWKERMHSCCPSLCSRSTHKKAPSFASGSGYGPSSLGPRDNVRMLTPLTRGEPGKEAHV